MTHNSPFARTAIGALLILASPLTPLRARPASGPAPGRIVAVADVHGAFDEFVSILHETGLINGQRAWAGGTATFVQTGDVVDRGARTRECLDLLMDLERQAPASGGKVIALLGNHEVMNVIGDLRYVTKAIYQTFATGDSDRRRDQAYKECVEFLGKHSGHGHALVPPTDPAAQRAWMDDHPAGFFEYRDAFAPDGTYGKWIRSHHALVQIGDGLFLHAGLSPTLEFGSVRELDERVVADLPAFDAMWKELVDARVIWRSMTFTEAVRFAAEELAWQQSEGAVGVLPARLAVLRLLGYKAWITVSGDGPLWYRGLATEPEAKLDASLTALLARLNVKYLVAGHSVVASKQAAARFDSRVFLIDTGMLSEVYAGRGSALEIRDGQFIAHQVGATPRLLPGPASARMPEPVR
jgi:hypothetical protein